MEQLTTFGMLCALALAITLAATAVEGRRQGLDYGRFIRFAVLSIPFAWLMSRVVFVLASCTYFLEEVEDASLALHFWDGGYSIMGAYAGLLLAAFCAARWMRYPVGKLLDALALGMPLGLMIERLAERGTGLGEGAEVSQSWPALLSIETEYGTLLTVFVFEAAAAVLILLALLLWSKLCRKRRDGDMMAMFTMLFGCTQVLLESFRSDGHMEIHMGVHIQQVIAAVMIVIVIGYWMKRAFTRGTVSACWIIPFVLISLVPVSPLLTLAFLALNAVLYVLKRTSLWQRWSRAISTVYNAVMTIALVALAVVAEFGVDRWDNKVQAYGLMIICLVCLFILGVHNQCKSFAE